MTFSELLLQPESPQKKKITDETLMLDGSGDGCVAAIACCIYSGLFICVFVCDILIKWIIPSSSDLHFFLSFFSSGLSLPL